MEQTHFYTELKSFLVNRNEDLNELSFDENTHLIRNGIIDSFAVTELILFIEDLISKPVEIEELKVDNIVTMESIYNFFIKPNYN